MEICRPGLRRVKTKLFLHVLSGPFPGLNRCHMGDRIELVGGASKGQAIQDVIAKPIRRNRRQPGGRRVKRWGRRRDRFRRERGGDRSGEAWNPGGQSLDALV